MTVTSGASKWTNRKKEYQKKCMRHNNYKKELDKTILCNKELETYIKKMNKKERDPEQYITTIQKQKVKKASNLLGYNKSRLVYLHRKIERTAP